MGARQIKVEPGNLASDVTAALGGESADGAHRGATNAVPEQLAVLEQGCSSGSGGADTGSEEPASEHTGALEPEGGAPVADVQAETEEHDPPPLHGREVDELELAALNWRRFAGIGPSELVELVAIGGGGLRVAYARGEAQYIKLLRDGERLPGVAGIYQVANQLTGRVRQLCKPGHWVVTNRRAGDAWVPERRVLPIDLDSVRSSGVSATDDEKAYCYEAADKIEHLLRQHVDPWAIGRGDSGNGLWLFIALQQIRRSDADDAQIAKLLKDLQKIFGSNRVKVDTSVANASRLVPAFGTIKRKGKDSPERPHRRTTFACHGGVRRVQLSELF